MSGRGQTEGVNRPGAIERAVIDARHVFPIGMPVEERRKKVLVGRDRGGLDAERWVSDQ